MVAAPYLLAKALVAAPWGPVGAWGLVLVGTVGLLASTLLAVRGGELSVQHIAPALSAIAMLAFGLSTGSPLAAAGAVAILLVGALVMGAGANAWHLAGALPGIWLISQGAAGLGYGVVVGVLLPAVAVVALPLRGLGQAPPRVSSKIGRGAALIGAVAVLLFAVYPQLVVEGLLRPAVGAMAGGVGAPVSLMSDWGTGLVVRSPQETLSAALPATGMAVAVFLAWVVLYWVRWLAERSRSAED